MRAVDTNVLVYSEMTSSPHHARARGLLRQLAQGSAPWAIPWPCIYEFLRVVTHPRVYHPVLPIDVALRDLNAILTSPSLVLLSENARHSAILDEVVRQSGASGNLMHDAHIVVLCLEHGVRELLTGDRDFSRFNGINVTNPFAT